MSKQIICPTCSQPTPIPEFDLNLNKCAGCVMVFCSPVKRQGPTPPPEQSGLGVPCYDCNYD